MTEIFFIVITIILCIIGLAGSLLPMLPGTPLIFLAALVYAWHTSFATVTWEILLLLLALLLLSQIMEYLASMIGAKKCGASRWGIIGALSGGIIGMIGGGLAGLIIGTFLGALVAELGYGKSLNASLHIGVGTVVGFVGGTIGKFIIALIMISVFLAAIFW